MSDVNSNEEQILEGLSESFMAALHLKDQGHIEKAEEQLREILKVEPRLAEPHLELARLLLDTDRVKEALEHAREALSYLKQGGQWTDEIPENVLLALAHAVVAEALRRHADEDDIIFGDAEVFKGLVKEAQEHFAEAARLDPADEYSSYYAVFMGPPKGVKVEMIGDEPATTPGEE